MPTEKMSTASRARGATCPAGARVERFCSLSDSRDMHLRGSPTVTTDGSHSRTRPPGSHLHPQRMSPVGDALQAVLT
jgi:hypothetical protein